MKHEAHERRRKIKNIRMEMKSLVHKLKRLHRIPVEQREAERKRLVNRQRTLEKKMNEIKNEN